MVVARYIFLRYSFGISIEAFGLRISLVSVTSETMAASTSGAFDTNAPFPPPPPPPLGGKKDSFEEFSYKLKARIGFVNPTSKVVLEKVEENLQAEINDNTFNDERGNPGAGLVWILVSLCSGPASTFLRRETATNGW